MATQRAPVATVLNVQSEDCQLCGVWSDATLCHACRISLPHRSAGGCLVCDVELVDTVAGICGACLADPPNFDATVSAFRYEFPLDRLMQSFKFRANLALTGLLAEALAGRIRARALHDAAPLPDCLVPMPLGRKRLAERGFNQAALLAAVLGKSLGVTSQAFDLTRVRETLPQSGLTRKKRLENVKGAFACERSLEGKHIALVDDVMTTGATLSEAAKVLKKAGAARVEAWVVARVTDGMAQTVPLEDVDVGAAG